MHLLQELVVAAHLTLGYLWEDLYPLHLQALDSILEHQWAKVHSK